MFMFLKKYLGSSQTEIIQYFMFVFLENISEY